jgi:hypothetical protein
LCKQAIHIRPSPEAMDSLERTSGERGKGC